MLEVFTPQVVACLNEEKYDSNGSHTPLFSTHCEILGNTRPPNINLDACGGEVQALMDEVISQKIATVNANSSTDWLYILSFGMLNASGYGSGNRDTKIVDCNLKFMVDRARGVFGMSEDWTVGR